MDGNWMTLLYQQGILKVEPVMAVQEFTVTFYQPFATIPTVQATIAAAGGQWVPGPGVTGITTTQFFLTIDNTSGEYSNHDIDWTARA